MLKMAFEIELLLMNDKKKLTTPLKQARIISGINAICSCDSEA